MKMTLILSVCVFLILMVALVGCNGEDSVDVGKYAIIKLPNDDIVEGEIQSLIRWTDSLTEVEIDGTTYCVHPLNITIVDKGE